MSDSEETQSQTSNQEPKLTINDLNLMANIINVCSKRGAFNANELKVTGELFEKLWSVCGRSNYTDGDVKRKK